MTSRPRLEPWAMVAAVILVFVAAAVLLCLVVANGWVDPAIAAVRLR